MWRYGLGGGRAVAQDINAAATNEHPLTKRSASPPVQRRDHSWNAGANGRVLRRIADAAVPMAVRLAPHARLRAINWSKQPTDIRRADLPPVSQLILTKRDQTT